MSLASQQVENLLMISESQEVNSRQKNFTLQDGENSTNQTGKNTKKHTKVHDEEFIEGYNKGHSDAKVVGTKEKNAVKMPNCTIQTPMNKTKDGDGRGFQNGDIPYLDDVQDTEDHEEAEGENGSQNNKKKAKVFTNDNETDGTETRKRKHRKYNPKTNSTKKECKIEIKADPDIIAKVAEEAVKSIEENPTIMMKDSAHYSHLLDFVRYAMSNPELFPVSSTAEGTHTPVRKIGKRGKCCYIDPQSNHICGKSVVYQCLECSLEQKEKKYYCVNPNNSDDRKVCFYLHKKKAKETKGSANKK